MTVSSFNKIRRFIRRSVVGYWAPAIAVYRICRKKQWNYLHQMRVIYRYTFGR